MNILNYIIPLILAFPQKSGVYCSPVVQYTSVCNFPELKEVCEISSELEKCCEPNSRREELICTYIR